MRCFTYFIRRYLYNKYKAIIHIDNVFFAIVEYSCVTFLLRFFNKILRIFIFQYPRTCDVYYLFLTNLKQLFMSIIFSLQLLDTVVQRLSLKIFL